MAAPTFYWHDYETFGTDPARDRPVQFAGLRTDADLNPVGEPLTLFARPADDYLPHPDACLVTGITPQRAAAEGVAEAEFISRIHEELARPGTCGVGYNSLRFDDEVTRYTLYRNFFDPYAREWQNGNSRWDLIDVVRTAEALRPEGIAWPLREDGLPSFRLEDLTAANGIAHEGAHDALVDVRATLAVAQLVRERQPGLFAYLRDHRDKRAAQEALDLSALRPVLHISGMFGAARHNCSLIVPLAAHPTNRNEVICYDLAEDPAPLVDGDAEMLRELLYTRGDELPEGVRRPGLKSVHLNRCPVLLPPKMLDGRLAERAGLDGDRCRQHLATLRAWRERDPRAVADKLAAIHTRPADSARRDPDLALYGGFLSDADRRLSDEVRATPPGELGGAAFAFEDARLPELLFRYRARNYPETLAQEEREAWEAFRYQRLSGEDGFGGLELEQFNARLEALAAGADPRGAALLAELQAWGDSLLA
ncbi:exodeoxyribonuclease I [Pseudohaliea sp.]|uniref:exodeoxyribonuclease I n=1 Tax=Pseudohaliea sp. TaxID=2740289 RepID=UPI0032EED114